MLNLKKTALAVLAFGSSAVFAGTMGPVCAPGAVTVPCAQTAWDFAGQALYLQPSYSGDEDFFGTTVAATSTGTNTTNYRNPLKWGWGFKLEGSYHFNTGNDVDLNWYHFNNNGSRTFAGTVTSLGATYGSPYVRVKPQWDAVNLEFGQHVDFGDAYNVRFHGDIAYVGIQNSLQASAATASRTVTTFTNAYRSRTAKFNGVGPRVGADMSYDWGNGFSMYANGATALFVGTKKFSQYTQTTTGVVNTANGSANQIVPELEAKLGATYTYAMSQGDLSLDAGWMWVNYFHANYGDSDFGLQGPFVGLKWVGNVV